MFQIFKHTASVFLMGAYLYGGTLVPSIEKTLSQSKTKYTISWKVGCTNDRPMATSFPAKVPQRFVKAKERLFFSPILLERLCTHQELNSNFKIYPLNSKCACLFLACSSLSERAPPTVEHLFLEHGSTIIR